MIVFTISYIKKFSICTFFLNNSPQNCKCCENETADVNVVIKYEESDDYCDCNNIVVKMMTDMIVIPPK